MLIEEVERKVTEITEKLEQRVKAAFQDSHKSWKIQHEANIHILNVLQFIVEQNERTQTIMTQDVISRLQSILGTLQALKNTASAAIEAKNKAISDLTQTLATDTDLITKLQAAQAESNPETAKAAAEAAIQASIGPILDNLDSSLTDLGSAVQYTQDAASSPTAITPVAAPVATSVTSTDSSASAETDTSSAAPAATDSSSNGSAGSTVDPATVVAAAQGAASGAVQGTAAAVASAAATDASGSPLPVSGANGAVVGDSAAANVSDSASDPNETSPNSSGA